VAAPVVRGMAPARARASGPAVLVSSVWSVAKGVELLAPIARRLADRPVLIQAPNGLPDEHRSDLTSLSNVTVRESATEIAALLDGASMVLVPSQHPEPFGRVAFEAMAAGVPMLASATGGLAEYVPHEQLVARFEDPGAWATAVRALEGERAWDAARRRGMAAATRVLASDPPRRIEGWLVQVAAGADSGAPSAVRA